MHSFKRIASLFLIVTSLIVTPAAFAQDAPLVVSTGKDGGTYSKMFKSILALCGDKVAMVEKTSTGSDENVDNLINKMTDLAFVQTDTLQFVAMNDPRAGEQNIRTLVPLHPEEVHVIVKDGTGRSVGGKWGFGGSVQPFADLSELAGFKVGAWGGSYTTARAIAYLGGVRYDVVRFDDDKQARAALDKGEIQAIIAVGGQPLGFAQGLGAGYRLLPINADLAGKVKAYAVTKISYRNLNAQGVSTVAARAYLVTKNYGSAARKAKIAALRQCIIENIDEFKEGTGHHPKWNEVAPTADTVWPLYDTSGVAPSRKK